MVNLLKLGHCSNCNAKVLDLEQRDPRKRKLDNYRENWFKLSDGSLMKVAICSECEKKIDKKMSDKIMDRHHATWEAEIDSDDNLPREKRDRIKKSFFDKKVARFGLDHAAELKKLK
jgi:ribosomal protein L28